MIVIDKKDENIFIIVINIFFIGAIPTMHILRDYLQLYSPELFAL